MSPHLDSAIVSTRGKSFHSQLLLLISSDINALRLQEARFHCRCPAQGTNGGIVGREFKGLIPLLLGRQIFEQSDLAILASCRQHNAVLCGRKLDGPQCRLRLMSINALPLVLIEFFPHSEHAILAHRGQKVARARVRPRELSDGTQMS